jgi:predicted RNase H-like nuclease
MSVLGVDAFSKGWVAVRLDAGGLFEAAFAAPTMVDVLLQADDVDVVAVDIPLGYPAALRRQADASARRFIGPMRSSVFETPPAAVWQAVDYAAAAKLSRELVGRGLTQQAWALRVKVLDADDAWRSAPERVYEVHPEVSFCALARRHIATRKATWAGMRERLDLLASVDIELPSDMGTAGVAGVDDVLDAGVAAWTARRIARGEASSLPDPPERDASGAPVAIWY